MRERQTDDALILVWFCAMAWGAAMLLAGITVVVQEWP